MLDKYFHVSLARHVIDKMNLLSDQLTTYDDSSGDLPRPRVRDTIWDIRTDHLDDDNNKFIYKEVAFLSKPVH